MRITLDHNDEKLDRICHVLKQPWRDEGESAKTTMIGIDEAYLAWFYIAPGQARSRTSLRMLEVAMSLMGPDAWAVIQIGEDGYPTLISDAGFRIVDSYHNEADGGDGLSVYIVQTAAQQEVP